MLLKRDFDQYIDNEGVSWETPLDWLWSGILGGCGCGSCESLAKKAWKVLKEFSMEGDDWNKRSGIVYKDQVAEVIAHWMDSKGLTEHGSGVAGSWLSDYGQEVFETINDLHKHEKEVKYENLNGKKRTA